MQAMVGEVMRGCEKRAAAAVAVLADLVDINSHSANVDGIWKVAERVEVMLREAGLIRSRRVVAPDGRIHLVASNQPAAAPRLRVLLLGHTDTVFPPDHPFNRFRRKGERATGPGVFDMKGGLVIMAETVAALRRHGWLDRIAVTALVNADEEIQSPTSRGLIEQTVRAGFDAALVFEGARKGGDVVRARKGVGRYVVRAHGRAAHAGINPQAGVNAIVELAHKIVALHALNDYEGGTTVNVGLVRGGMGRNTVPPNAEAELDVRVWDAAAAEAVDAALRRICAEPVLDGAAVDIEGRIGRPPWPPNQGSDALVQHWDAVGRVVGRRFAGVLSGGGSDGNFTHALGVPTLDGLGALGGGAHTTDEHIVLEGLWQQPALHACALAHRAGLLVDDATR